MEEQDKKEYLDDGKKLCEVCGSIMVLEDDRLICPNCDVQIDYFGEEVDEDISK
jgi:ribosomal protein S27AE